jgi:hypothetical protein
MATNKDTIYIKRHNYKQMVVTVKMRKRDNLLMMIGLRIMHLGALVAGFGFKEESWT